MFVLRRVLLPIAWLLVFGVIAAALVKMAFFDGLEVASDPEVPTAEVLTPTVPVALGTVANTIELTGTVRSDDAVPVRSSAQGEVVYLFAVEGDVVAEGEALYQVRRPAEDQPSPIPFAPIEGESDDQPTAAVEPPETVYEYFDVLATSPGTLQEFTLLLGESVSIGQTTGSVSPGSYSVSGTLTAAQQFRLLDRPSSAVISITGGAAPYTCSEPAITEPDAAGADGSATGPAVGPERSAMVDPYAPIPGPATDEGSTPAGQITCAVPADVPAFTGLSAEIVLSAGVAENVMTVPTTAVEGAVAQGLVWVQEPSGEAVEREVTLGLNDGAMVEITEGLTEGELVLEFVPGSDEPLNPGGYPVMGG